MMYRYRRPLRKDLLLFLAIALGWVLLGWYFRGDLALKAFSSSLSLAILFWAGSSAFLTVLALYWLDFFRPFTLNRFLPDFLTLWCLIPLAGLACKPLAIVLFGTGFLRSREIMLGAAVPALFAACLESIEQLATRALPVKSIVYLALTDGEKERFLESFRSGGWERYFRFLSPNEFNGALVTGGRLDYVILSRSATKNFLVHQNILRAHMRGVTVLDYQTVMSHMRGHISINDTDIWTFLAGSQRRGTFDQVYGVMKFYLEPVLAGFLILVLSPIFLIVAALIKATSRGPVFFSQRRTGMLGEDFDLYKLRTMRMDAESNGPQWAGKNDNRVTAIGRILRKTRLDELPQLWNVMRGEIGFVGPRPERPEFYRIIEKECPHFNLRLLVRPGITGWAQLLGGYASTIEESERKLEYDLYYMRYMSPRTDFIVWGKTIMTLLRGNSGR